jgi:2-polyprenyl-6-methoxyphenol hydroxylase-like FAD-dependent oxidoreductase
MTADKVTDVVVVGAGPVGLYGALCLARRGVRVEIVDREPFGAVRSFAVGLHAETLRRFEQVGLARGMVDRGNAIHRLVFFEGPERVQDAELAGTDATLPPFLALPQSVLEGMLERSLRAENVHVRWNHRLEAISEGPDSATVTVAELAPVASRGSEERAVVGHTEIETSFIIGADGIDSFARKHLKLEFASTGPAETYSIFEFVAALDCPHDLHIVFDGPHGSALWPINENQGRWSLGVDPEANLVTDARDLYSLIRSRAPWFAPRLKDVSWSAVARFDRGVVERFGRGRIWLAGDAAHTAGPCASHSMNAGIQEAYDLATRMAEVIADRAGSDHFETYDARCRRRWQELQALGDRIEASAAPAWLKHRAAGIQDFLPVSGPDLDGLLARLGAA